MRQDLKLFLTDGWLIFGKPVAGRIVAAYFAEADDGGDAEVLLTPPDTGERRSLTRFTGRPTLNEHFKSSLLVFTDATGDELLNSVSGRTSSPEMGNRLASSYSGALRNILHSFETRIVQDVASEVRPEDGLFFAALGQTPSGNFDVIYDPQSHDQIIVASLKTEGSRTYYDIWTSFPARNVRNGAKAWSDFEFLVKSVNIDAEITPTLGTAARTTLTIELPANSRRRMNVLAFDISRRMRVTSARVDGVEAAVLQRESLRSNLLRGSENEMFLVNTRADLAPGRHSVEFQHQGTVILPAGNGVFFVSARGMWYPQHGLQFAPFEIEFRYPKQFTVVATGELVEDRVEGETRYTRRRTGVPVRIAGFNLGEYRKYSASKGVLSVDVYANRALETALATRKEPLLSPTPPTPQMPRPGRPVIPRDQVLLPSIPVVSSGAAVERIASAIADTFDYFARKFGPPPLKHLEVSPIPGVFGQGFPGLIYLSTIAFLDPADRPDAMRDSANQMFFSELLYAHETAHQWWGNQVASNNYRDDWLMEALANYSSLMAVEHRKGGKIAERTLDNYRAHLLEKTPDQETIDSAGPIRLGTRLESSRSPKAWRVITYEKGTWILHMLRRRLGDAGFDTLLRRLNEKYARQNLTTELFLAEAVLLLPKSDPDPKLENFRAAWIDGTGIPRLKLNYGMKPGSRLEGVVEQTEAPEDFTIDVPVEIQYPGGRSEVRWVRTDGGSTAFSWKLRAAPRKVLLDPTSSVLALRK